MKLLFLDIDGVLNHCETAITPNAEFLDSDCIANLNYILDQVPELRIVLCSAWRKHESLSQNQKDLERFGFKGRLHSETPILRGQGQLFNYWNVIKYTEHNKMFPTEREFEIYAFVEALIENGVEVDSLCIVDDLVHEVGKQPRYSDWYGTHFAPYSVTTYLDNGGLTKEKADAVVKILTTVTFEFTANPRLELYRNYEECDIQACKQMFPRTAFALETLKNEAEQKIKLL